LSYSTSRPTIFLAEESREASALVIHSSTLAAAFVYKTFIVVVPWQGNVYSWEKGGFAMQSVKQRKRTEKRKRKGRRIGD
jgi:hypothetical protein